MKEIRNIVAAGEKALAEGKQVALATVVHVEGSSYRRPGARMLITEEGTLTGAISGGCLEGDALRKALFVMAQQKPMLVTYDTMDDDDAKFGVGLGCNGIIQVLLEPIQPLQENNPLQLLQQLASERANAVLVTVFSLDNKKDPQQGTCLLVKEQHVVGEITSELSLKEVVLADATIALESRTSAFKNYTSSAKAVTAFLEMVPPAVSLVILGAGNDLIPLVQMADIIGWETTVVDGRPSYAKQERFTSACQVLVSKPEQVLSQVSIDEKTIFLLMTHNYNYDLAMLKELVKSDLVYIGILGPTKKLQRMLDELAEQGSALDPRQVAMIHSPMGLDIGAETPEEIALSILAEVKAVIAGRQGNSLKGQPSTIHSRAATTIEEVRVTSNL